MGVFFSLVRNIQIRKTVKFLGVIAGVVFSSLLCAQDSHYWSIQFGTRSSLLSGAVVAGYNSNTMVFYNPSSLAMLDSSSFSINASLYQLELIRVRNKTGLDYDLKGSQFDNIPLMFSGTLRNRKNPDLRFGYGVMSPTNFTFHGSVQDQGFGDLIMGPESPGFEPYVAQIGVDSKLTETLFIGGLGYKINESLAIGTSLGLVARSHRYTRSFLSRVLINSFDPVVVPDATTSDINASMYYFQARAYLKLGFHYTRDRHSAGLTFTTPGFTVYSDGKVRGDMLITNTVLTDSMRINILANDDQRKLPARYKTPWSIAAGYAYHWDNASVYISAEYFDGIPIYKIIDTDPMSFVFPVEVAEDYGVDTILSVFDASKPVFNLALGYEQRLNDFFSLLAGFRTNISRFDNALLKVWGISPTSTSWDIYYLTVGGRFSNTRNDLMIGVQFGYGDSGPRDNIVFDGDIRDDLLFGLNNYSSGRYYTVGLILGWNYIFRSNPDKKRKQ